MKQLLTIAALLVTFVLPATAAEGWLTDLEEAKKQAKEQNKPILAEFTGTSWCAPCRKLAKEVTTKEDFIKAASEKFVLLKIDYKPESAKAREKVGPIVKQYKVRVFPSALILDAEGKELSRFRAARYMSPELFLAQLDKEKAKIK